MPCVREKENSSNYQVTCLKNIKCCIDILKEWLFEFCKRNRKIYYCKSKLMIIASTFLFYFVFVNICSGLNDKQQFQFLFRYICNYMKFCNEWTGHVNKCRTNFWCFSFLGSNKKNQEQHDDPELLNALFERTTMITLRPVPAIIFKRLYKI